LIDAFILTHNFKIEHDSKGDPLVDTDFIGSHIQLATNNKVYNGYLLKYTSNLYESIGILSAKPFDFVDTYFSDGQTSMVLSPVPYFVSIQY